MPVNKRSVARGTGDIVVNKLGKALADDGLAENHKKINKLGKALVENWAACKPQKEGLFQLDFEVFT